MQLHRASGTSDWVTVKPAERNFWQRLAAGSGGVLTPGNAITIAGLLAVAYGIRLIADGSYASGLGWIVGGRLADLLDGLLAENTGTKSPLGEALDATCDKLGTIATLVVLIIQNILPWWLALVLLLPHAVISAVSLAAKFQGRQPHPSRLGKISMALLWSAIVLLVVWQLPRFQHYTFGPDTPGWAVFTAIFINAVAAASAICGFVAMAGYVRAYVRRKA